MTYPTITREELERQLEIKKKIEEEKRRILSLILTSEAKSRLKNIELVRPELAEQVTTVLLQLYSQGRIRRPLTDAEFKEILKSIIPKKKETTIRRTGEI